MKVDNKEHARIQAQALPWQLPLTAQLVALKSQRRLPHGLLIEVRSAVDSRAFGWHLSMALLCQSQQDGQPCGHCPACVAMLANNYPDFSFTTLEINERNHKLYKDIRIEQIRKLIHQMSLTHSLESGKIALIYPAEKLNAAAANALLKTLEEPSQDSVLIILTHNPGRLPVTIRSRCQHWVVENPDQQTAMNWLQAEGLPLQDIPDYLALSQQDAQLAVQLYQQQFKQQYDRFTELFEQYRQDSIDVVSLVQALKKPSAETLRLVLKSAVQNMIYTVLQQPLTSMVKQQLSALLQLFDRQQHLLSIEDNNLNLQLQLEDVLISLKQIISEDNHGRSQSGHFVP